MELRFKIKEIPALGAPLHVRRWVPSPLLVDVLEGTDGDPTQSEVGVELQLMRDHDDVIGTGRLRGRLVLPCARCVEPATYPVDARIDLVFSRHLDDHAKAEDVEADIEAIVAEPDRFKHDGVNIELEPALRELLIAELPISPLCKPGCLGLCPVCGADKNTALGRACGHVQVDDVDVGQRGLAALASVKVSS